MKNSHTYYMHTSMCYVFTIQAPRIFFLFLQINCKNKVTSFRLTKKKTPPGIIADFYVSRKFDRKCFCLICILLLCLFQSESIKYMNNTAQNSICIYLIYSIISAVAQSLAIIHSAKAFKLATLSVIRMLMPMHTHYIFNCEKKVFSCT